MSRSHVLTKLNNFSFLNETEMFKVLFDTKIFHIYRSTMSPFYEPTDFFIEYCAHCTFTLAEFIVASMLLKGLIAF